MVKLTKKEQLDLIAELEIEAIIHKLKNKESLTAADLSAVRKFMNDNYLLIDPDTKGVPELNKALEDAIPDFTKDMGH